MKCAPLAAAVAAGAFLCACAGTPPASAPKTRVSSDYEAVGDASGARAFVYGKRTVLEFTSRPIWLTIEDENGVAVPYEREGRYYRLASKVDRFTVWANARTLVFTKVEVPEHAWTAQQPQKVDAQPVMLQPENGSSPSPTSVDPEQKLQDEASALLQLSSRQLEEVRKAIVSSTSSSEIKVLNAKLDRIESQLVSAATLMIRVQFDNAGTEFAADSGLLRVLVRAAKSSERINVRGRTDARIAGSNDPEIALGRALAARDYLVKQGIDARKIKVFALPAGDFIAPSGTKAGRALNRRVEIELVNQRSVKLVQQTAQLQRGKE